MSHSTSPVLRNVDKRRQLFCDFKRLYRHSGHGVYKETVDGAPAGERERVTFHLRRNFGETFAEGAFFYKNPDRNLFLSHILRAGTGAAIPRDADLSGLFVTRNNYYSVDENAMARLGCSKQALYDLFSALPRGLERGRPIVLTAEGPLGQEVTRDPAARPSKRIKPSPPDRPPTSTTRSST